MADAKRAHSVAREIEMDIVQGGWQVGRNLGVESDLALRYGVGRDLMRQALALVVRSGLATVRRGRDGGVIIAAPSDAAATAALRNYLEITPPLRDDLMLARRRFENLLIQLAVERQQDEDADRFRGLAAELDRADCPDAFDSRVFAAITTAARNPYLALIASALHGLSAGAGAEGDIDARRVARLRGAQLTAIVAGDLAEALAANTEIVRLLKGEPGAGAAGMVVAPAPAGLKLGEQIAVDIRRRVALGEFSPGDRIGSEAELRAEYRASRGVVREAIRLLEHLSLASSVRGPTGGLYVTAPSGESVLRTTGLYLRGCRVSARSLMEVGEVLDLLCAELAARKFPAHPPEQAADALRRLSQLRTAPLRERALSYYGVLSDLAATPLVGILLPLHASLVEIHPVAALEEAEEGALLDRLMRAIQAGDPILARSAMMAIRRRYGFHIPPPQSLGEAPVLALLSPRRSMGLTQRNKHRPN